MAFKEKTQPSIILPAAVTFGVLLSAPSAGQTVIGANVNHTVQLSDAGLYPNGGPFIISHGVTINSSAAGAFAITGASATSLMNDGDILATGNGASSIGLLLGGAVANNGSLIAGSDGIHTTNAAASLANAGLITAGYDGISLDAGGTVINNLGAAISAGHIGVYTGAAASSVTNSGLVTASTGDGVSLYQGGNFSNSATGNIHGGYAGVYLGGSGFSMQNAGIISGADYGVLLHGNTLQNDASGAINGGRIGVYAGSGAMISNAGDISGDTGIKLDGNGGTIFNTGTIASTGANGNAIAFDAAGVNDLVLATGSVIDGAINGGGSASQIDLTGTGALNNNINNFGPGSALFVHSGADWTASGNWQIATFTNDGTFQPGLLAAPLVFTGNYVQSPTAVMRVIVSPTDSSHFIITGTAHLAGDLVYVFAPGVYTPKTYHFITATDGVTGSFADPVYNGARPTALVGAAINNDSLNNAANLVLQSNVVVAPADASLFNAISQAAANNAQQQNTQLLNQQTGSNSGSCGSVRPASASTASGLASAMAASFCAAGGWVQVTGTIMNVNASAGAPDYRGNTGGFLAGIDRPANDYGTRIGLAVGYDETWLHDNADGKAMADTTSAGIYVSQPVGRYMLAADFLYGHADNTTSRATGIGSASGKSGSNIFAGGAQINTHTPLGKFIITPAAGVKFASVNSGGFSETGSGAIAQFTVSGAASRYISVQPFVNLSVSRVFLTPSNIVIIPALGIGYDYEAGGSGNAVTVTANEGTQFSTPHNHFSASTAVLAAGITAGKNNFALYAHYNADLAGNWHAQMAEAGLEYKF